MHGAATNTLVVHVVADVRQARVDLHTHHIAISFVHWRTSFMFGILSGLAKGFHRCASTHQPFSSSP